MKLEKIFITNFTTFQNLSLSLKDELKENKFGEEETIVENEEPETNETKIEESKRKLFRYQNQ